jgi:hypothetical protein
MMKNSNKNLITQQFLMHPNYILRKISVVNVHIEALIKKSYKRHN